MSSYDYYRFDYNNVFDSSVDSNNLTVSSPHASWKGDAKADLTTESTNSNYIGYQDTFSSSGTTGAFSGFSGFHIVFNWYEYGYNSTTGTFANNVTTAGKYGVHLNHGATEANTNIFRNATNTSLFTLSDKYTFQNKVNNRSATLLLSRKNSNAFTFDKYQTTNFGQTSLTDTAGNTVSNPRWGFTDFKMIAKCVSGSTDVVEFYMYNGTEQVVKFTPDSSNKLSLHTTAGNTIWETDTNGVLFNSLTVPAATSPYSEASMTDLTVGFTPPSGTDHSYFGWSSEIAGDWLMIGEPRADDGRGAVRSYKRINGTWTYQNKIVASDRDIAISGDVGNDNVTNDFGFFGWSISMLDTGSEGIFMVIGAPGIKDDNLDPASFVNSTYGAVYFYNKPQNSDTWTEIKDKDLAGNILTRTNDPNTFVTTHMGFGRNSSRNQYIFSMGSTVKLSKINNYIIAFVACPDSLASNSANIGKDDSTWDAKWGNVIMYYYHRTRNQFVLVRYDNEESLSNVISPKPVFLKHSINNGDGLDSYGEISIHIHDSTDSKWAMIGFPNGDDSHAYYSYHYAHDILDYYETAGRVELWDISDNAINYTETNLVETGTTGVISTYSNMTANCGFPYFKQHYQIGQYTNTLYAGSGNFLSKAFYNHKKYFTPPMTIGNDRYSDGGNDHRARTQNYGQSIATTVIDGVTYMFIGHSGCKVNLSKGYVHVYKLLIPDPSNTNEPTLTVASLVTLTSGDAVGKADTLKGRWMYHQTFNRPNFDDIPFHASSVLPGGSKQALHMDAWDDYFGYCIKASGKNVFVSAPALSHSKGKVYVFSYNSNTGYFTNHASNIYIHKISDYANANEAKSTVANVQTTIFTPQSAIKEFVGDVSYNTFGNSISIYGTGSQQELIITGANGLNIRGQAGTTSARYRNIANRKNFYPPTSQTGGWLHTRAHNLGPGLHPNTGQNTFLAGIVKHVTIYDTTFDTAASDSGISQSDITTLKSVNFGTVTNNKAIVDSTTKAKLKSIVDNATDVADKRKKIRSSLRLIFAQDNTVKKIVVDKDDIGLGKKFIKSKVLVVKAGETFDVNDLSQNEGFYSTLNNSENFSVKLKNTTVTFTRTDDSDNNELYYLSVTDNNFDKLVMNTDGVTGTFRKNNVNGTLKPDDELIIDGRRFVISSVADGGAAGSGGDPYIYPINSNVPVKLPDKTAFYRMFEQGNNFINVSVEKASLEHQQRMKDFVTKVAPNAKNVVTDGFFYKYCFIHAEGHEFIMDYATKNIYTSEEDIQFFDIKQNVEMFDCGEFKEAAINYQISWTTNTGEKIVTQLLFFRNPHMENGIKVIPETTFRSTGLIVENYKPELMELPDLKTKKYSKIWRDLYKTKNKYQNKNIKEKNEKWYFN